MIININDKVNTLDGKSIIKNIKDTNGSITYRVLHDIYPKYKLPRFFQKM